MGGKSDVNDRASAASNPTNYEAARAADVFAHPRQVAGGIFERDGRPRIRKLRPPPI